MSSKSKYRGINAAIAGAVLSVSTGIAMAAGSFDNLGNVQGPTLGKISTNVASSFVGIASGFEAFLYLIGVVLMVMCILAAWKYKKSDGREGNMGLICTYLVLSVCSFSAPTVLASMGVTLFGSGTRTTISAPTTPSFN